MSDDNISLWDACHQGEVEYIAGLLQKRADINYKRELCDDSTPLHAACCSGSDETVRYLVDNDADVNAVDRLHKTPLHEACRFRDSISIVKLLLSRRANVNAVTRVNGTPPLVVAANIRCRPLIMTLIDAGADIHKQANCWGGLLSALEVVHNDAELVHAMRERCMFGAGDWFVLSAFAHWQCTSRQCRIDRLAT
jgi:ankyrin repeat protein